MMSYSFYFASKTCSFMKGVIFMTYKQIEASREARLWLGQIIAPAITLAVSTLAIPEVRQAVAAKAESIKKSIKEKNFKVVK